MHKAYSLHFCFYIIHIYLLFSQNQIPHLYSSFGFFSKSNTTTLSSTEAPFSSFSNMCITIAKHNTTQHHTSPPNLIVILSSSFLQTEHHNNFNMQQMINEKVARMAQPEHFLAHHVELDCQLHRKSPRGFRHTTRARRPGGGCHEEKCQVFRRRRCLDDTTSDFFTCLFKLGVQIK